MKTYGYFDFQVKSLEEAKAIVDYSIKSNYHSDDKDEIEDSLTENSDGTYIVCVNNINECEVNFIINNLFKKE